MEFSRISFYILMPVFLFFSDTISPEIQCANVSQNIHFINPIPDIYIHSSFYPHPHMRDIKKLAQRGKILVITLIVSAGLITLVSTALIKDNKGENSSRNKQKINPTELRSYAIASVIAARGELPKGRKAVIEKAFNTYSIKREIQYEKPIIGNNLVVTGFIGEDIVTVKISDSYKTIEVVAESGSICAVASINTENGSVKSHILTTDAVDRRGNIS